MDRFLQRYADHGQGWELQTYTGYFRLIDYNTTLTRCWVDDNDFIHWIGKKHDRWLYISIPLYEMKGYDSSISTCVYCSFHEKVNTINIECSEEWSFEWALVIPFANKLNTVKDDSSESSLLICLSDSEKLKN